MNITVSTCSATLEQLQYEQEHVEGKIEKYKNSKIEGLSEYQKGEKLESLCFQFNKLSKEISSRPFEKSNPAHGQRKALRTEKSLLAITELKTFNYYDDGVYPRMQYGISVRLFNGVWFTNFNQWDKEGRDEAFKKLSEELRVKNG